MIISYHNRRCIYDSYNNQKDYFPSRELGKRGENDSRRRRGKTLSAVIQDALRITRKERLKKEFYRIQGYWSRSELR